MKRKFIILTMLMCLNMLAQAQTETFTVNGVEFTMVKVEGGTYTMGATSEQKNDVFNEEKPAHKVNVNTFSIGETEVTQELWKAVMDYNSSVFRGDQRPVETVSLSECQAFISKLNSLTGKNFRLPTEEEWEYAARGGKKSKNTKYSGSSDVGSVAWYESNSGNETHNVKTKSPNKLGIYDMSGNVAEFTSSNWRDNYNASTDAVYYVYRGGSYFSIARCTRVSFRSNCMSHARGRDIGFRLAL